MRTACGVFVFQPGGRVLICRPTGPAQKHGWTIPKGHMEEGETREQTAAREAKEECGIVIDPDKLIYMGRGEYKRRRKELYGFAYHPFDRVDVDKLECKSLTDKGWPEVDKFEMVQPDEAIKRLHYVQGNLLREWWWPNFPDHRSPGQPHQKLP